MQSINSTFSLRASYSITLSVTGFGLVVLPITKRSVSGGELENTIFCGTVLRPYIRTLHKDELLQQTYPFLSS